MDGRDESHGGLEKTRITDNMHLDIWTCFSFFLKIGLGWLWDSGLKFNRGV